MLNYKFAMRWFLIGFLSVFWVPVQQPFSSGLGQALDSPAIQAPSPGAAIQGSVPIRGTIPAEGFEFAELAFSYENDPTGTLFPLANLEQPVIDGMLADWDTTSITDGNYVLHLIVFQTDGTRSEALVTGLRVRNYTAIETSTPAPTETPLAGSSPVETPTATPLPRTPTPLPDNPARLTSGNIAAGLIRGLGLAVIAFVVFGLYLGLRAVIRR